MVKSIQKYYPQLKSEQLAEHLNVGPTGWATGVLSVRAQLPKLEDLTAYYPYKIDKEKNEIDLTTVSGVFDAEDAFMVCVTPNTRVQFEVPDENVNSTFFLGNLLKPATEDLSEVKNKIYVLGKYSDTEVAFMNYEADVLPAGRCYLEKTDVNLAKALTFNFEDITEVTGINEVSAAKADNGRIYNLQGQMVKTPQKGQIYIVNGRKIIY